MASPYAGLLAAAGATQGFEQLLARRFEGEKLEEAKRATREKERLAAQAAAQQEQEFGANEQYRQQQLQSGEQLKMIQLLHAQAVSDAATQDRRSTQKWRESEATANREWRGQESQMNRDNQVTLRSMADAGRAAAQKPRYQVVQNAEGGMVRVNLDENRSEPVMGANGQVQPESSSERLVQRTRDQIKPTIDRLKLLSNHIHTASGPQQLANGAKQWTTAQVNMNPLTDEYLRLREATALSLAAIANQGRPTEPDRQAIEKVLPGLGTRRDVAQNLWKAIDRIIAKPEKYGSTAAVIGELQAPAASNSFNVGGFKVEEVR